MSENPDYYKCAVEGYVAEEQNLIEAFKEFMPGRTWQFLQLVEDYREAFVLLETITRERDELLEACKAAVAFYGDDCYKPYVHGKCIDARCSTRDFCWLPKVKAALAKAEGRK